MDNLWIWSWYGWCTLWLCQTSCWKWPFMADLPIQHGDFPYLCKRLPEENRSYSAGHGPIFGFAACCSHRLKEREVRFSIASRDGKYIQIPCNGPYNPSNQSTRSQDVYPQWIGKTMENHSWSLTITHFHRWMVSPRQPWHTRGRKRSGFCVLPPSWHICSKLPGSDPPKDPRFL